MKEIPIPFRSSFKIHLKKGKETKVISYEELELYKKIRKRGQAIVQSGLDIEEYVKELIAKMLFQNSKDSDFLIGVLLDSSACTFGAKRKIFTSSLDHFDILEKAERNEIDEHLAKVMRYRNAFAHGKISTKEPFYIEYFEGIKQKKELTEEYWDTLAEYLESTFKILKKAEDIISKR